MEVIQIKQAKKLKNISKKIIKFYIKKKEKKLDFLNCLADVKLHSLALNGF